MVSSPPPPGRDGHPALPRALTGPLPGSPGTTHSPRRAGPGLPGLTVGRPSGPAPGRAIARFVDGDAGQVTAGHDVLVERGPGRPRPGGAGRLAGARGFWG